MKTILRTASPISKFLNLYRSGSFTIGRSTSTHDVRHRGMSEIRQYGGDKSSSWGYSIAHFDNINWGNMSIGMMWTPDVFVTNPLKIKP